MYRERKQNKLKSMIQVLLVEEKATIRHGVRMRLSVEPDFSVVGEVGDGNEALTMVRELRPDVVLTGVRLPGMDGIALAERLHVEFPECVVVILSLYDDPDTRKRAMEAGASSFISKQNPDSDIPETIRLVMVDK
jgi:two-component system response regulator DesR